MLPPNIEREFNERLGAYNADKQSLSVAWHMGQALKKAKGCVDDGKWTDFLKAQGLADRLSRRLLQLYDGCTIAELGKYSSLREASDAAGGRARIQRQFDERWEEMNVLGRRTLEAAWKVGQTLKAMKEQQSHGGWLPWLERNDIAQTTAYRLIQLHDGFKTSQLGKFRSVDEAIKTLPKPVRQQARTPDPTPETGDDKPPLDPDDKFPPDPPKDKTKDEGETQSRTGAEPDGGTRTDDNDGSASQTDEGKTQERRQPPPRITPVQKLQADLEVALERADIAESRVDELEERLAIATDGSPDVDLTMLKEERKKRGEMSKQLEKARKELQSKNRKLSEVRVMLVGKASHDEILTKHFGVKTD